MDLLLDPSNSPTFHSLSKRINAESDLRHFKASPAYNDLTHFILLLNTAMFPTQLESDTSPNPNPVQTWALTNPAITLSPTVQHLRDLITKLDAMIAEAPPDTAPRRFGNASFRTWLKLVEERSDALLAEHVPATRFDEAEIVGKHGSARQELRAYFLGSFGSAQRLDFGTGHELSFLAFLGGIWKMGGFETGRQRGEEERAIVVGVIEPYITLMRKLILTYTLEPAGSHGVWGLDDHFFLPYIFGSAQLAAPIILPASSSSITATNPSLATPPSQTPQTQPQIPTEGSSPSSPPPNSILTATNLTKHAPHNLYFAAILFIHQVKRGPFWEHSPTLYDISGVEKGWAKINQGMLRMWGGEVLGKWVVVQHFGFGGLFRWE